MFLKPNVEFKGEGILAALAYISLPREYGTKNIV